MLPKGPMYGNWSDLQGKIYRLSGFGQSADPDQTGHGPVIVDGVIYQRLGFLEAPVALFPCAPTTPKFIIAISSRRGGSVTVPGEEIFQYSANTLITLQATPDHGYVFDKWHLTREGGSQTHTGEIITARVVSKGTVLATFRPASQPNY